VPGVEGAAQGFPEPRQALKIDLSREREPNTSSSFLPLCAPDLIRPTNLVCPGCDPVGVRVRIWEAVPC
jgi:hypothetical protein